MSRAARNGVSFVEVLVVVAIIALVAGLLLPATRRVREPAMRMQCSNNLKQLMLGMHNYCDSNAMPAGVSSSRNGDEQVGRFPPGCFGPGTTPEERLSWMVDLLPFLEQDNLYRQFALDKDYTANLSAAQTRVRTLVCPAGKDAGTSDAVTHYIAMAGIGHDAAGRPTAAIGNGFMGYDRPTSMAMIKDGASQTIAVIETRSGLGPWARGGASTLRGFDPADVPIYGDDRPFGGHPRGMNAAMADGSVRFIRSSIDPKNLAAAITIAGDEPVDLD